MSAPTPRVPHTERQPRCGEGALEVLATGPLATVQDLGRPGCTHIGVGLSGAADRGALALGNRLVANPPGAAGIEVTFGGLALRTRHEVLVAVTGAPCAVTVDGRDAAANAVAKVSC